MAIFQNIEVYAGRRIVIPITYKVAGVAVDITDYTFTFMAKLQLDTTNAAASLNIDAALVTPADGTMTLTLRETDTAALKAGTYLYDFTAYDANDFPHHIEQSTFTLKTPVNLYE